MVYASGNERVYVIEVGGVEGLRLSTGKPGFQPFFFTLTFVHQKVYKLFKIIGQFITISASSYKFSAINYTRYTINLKLHYK